MGDFVFLGNCSSNSGSEEMGGSEESTEDSTTSPSAPSPRYSHTHVYQSARVFSHIVFMVTPAEESSIDVMQSG